MLCDGQLERFPIISQWSCDWQVKFRGFPADWNDWASTKEFDKCSLREHLGSLGKASSGLNCTPVTTSGIFKYFIYVKVVYYLHMFLFNFTDLHMDQNLPRRIKTLRISPFQLHDQLPGRPKTRQRAVFSREE